MTIPRHHGCLLRETDLTKTQFVSLLASAAELKAAKVAGTESARLTGRNIALMVEKSSTRTRCAVEVAAHDQGAHVTYLDPSGSHLGREESVPDTAQVLGRMFDGIALRGFSQTTVEQLADNAGVPVVNGLTDAWHPTQMLADVLTMTEHDPRPLEEIVYCFLGDGRNTVARSLLVTGALLGMNVRIGAPRDFWPPDDVVALAQRLAVDSGARILVTEDAAEAVAGADFVYTDVWVSMSESAEEWEKRVPLLLPYRVTEDLIRSSGKWHTKFMHCLPAVHDLSTEAGRKVHEQYGLHGAEVSDEVFRSSRSIVLDQAENQLHTMKAVLIAALAR